MPRWILMWTVALAIYGWCKWLTYWTVHGRIGVRDRRRVLGYLLAWPGMDAEAFLSTTNAAIDRPSVPEWTAAGLKLVFGGVLTWIVARWAWPESPLVAGWIGMTGAIFMLHFGTFQLLSLAWRRAGVDAAPLMRNPARSTSLGEFWGRRWNTAFHELASQYAFKAMRPSVGVLGATLTTFLASGLIHELVITVPAGGGYGLPTSYFALQGVGLASERSELGRWLGLGRGWRGWMFTALVAVGPVFWLFPPPFVHSVVLPMLGAIGAV